MRVSFKEGQSTTGVKENSGQWTEGSNLEDTKHKSMGFYKC